ncbi:pyridoxamine 5'-phosphate oxidase family protein [soil metagenome]
MGKRQKVAMGQVYDGLHDGLTEFIRQQHIFFVATGPLAGDGRINLSPKGLDTFRILGPTTVAYLDLTGSGVETAAHLRENGRMTVMFCAFAGRPLILRLYGRGRVIEPIDAEWARWAVEFPVYPGIRSVVVLEVDRIATSCGFGVPLYDYREVRTQLSGWSDRLGPEGLARYRSEKNSRSIDGLEGLRSAGRRDSREAGGHDVP